MGALAIVRESVDGVREWFGYEPTKVTLAERQMTQAEIMRENAMAYVREGMMVALSLALEDRGWIESGGAGETNRSKTSLTLKAIHSAALNARALATGNPLIRTALQAKLAYILSEPVRIKKAGTVVKNKRNRQSLFGKAALMELITSKATDGNIFFLLEGVDILRIPFHEIKGAVYDPQDASFIQYFYREWEVITTDFETGVNKPVTMKRLYPNMDYGRGGVPHSDFMQGVPVHQTGVIRHVAPNRLVGDPWGLPDMIAGIFYAGEHKELIEAADSIFRAQSQYAVQYKTKTRKALESVAASIAAPAPIDPATGDPMNYGQSIAFGQDIEMQLMSKIGAGIDFAHFDPIAALATSVLGVPLETILGKEKTGEALAPTTVRIMRNEQQFWDEVLNDILEWMGKPNAVTYWPPIDPDATHRQVQSIAGAAQLRVISPEETRGLLRDTFGADWEDTVPDPSEWDDFLGSKATTVVPGSTEPGAPNDGPITPGQGQTGKLGKLADGDHELRDAGEQAHTQK